MTHVLALLLGPAVFPKKKVKLKPMVVGVVVVAKRNNEEPSIDGDDGWSEQFACAVRD
jgi:hypothetical protein